MAIDNALHHTLVDEAASDPIDLGGLKQQRAELTLFSPVSRRNSAFLSPGRRRQRLSSSSAAVIASVQLFSRGVIVEETVLEDPNALRLAEYIAEKFGTSALGNHASPFTKSFWENVQPWLDPLQALMTSLLS